MCPEYFDDDFNMDAPFMTEQSTVVHSLKFEQLSVCINCVLLHEEVSLTRTGRSSNLRDRYLKNSFMNIHFAKILVGSHLQPMNSQTCMDAGWQTSEPVGA